jgi:hypothetical protein
VNAHPQQRGVTQTPAGTLRLLTPQGQPLIAATDRLRDMALPTTDAPSSLPEVAIEWVNGVPQARIEVPPRSVRLLVTDGGA